MNMLEEYFEEEKRKKLENYKRLNRFIKKGQTLFVGSSLMEQFPIYELMLDCVSNKTIYNRGIGGYTTLEMIEALDVCIFDLEPREIFINIGTNDLNGEDYSQEELIKNYDKILTLIQKRLVDVKIYLLAYFPVNIESTNNPWMQEILRYRTNERINEANRELEKLAIKKSVQYININKNLYDENNCLKKEYSVDGIHIYPDGYQGILDELLVYVNI